MIIGDWIVLCKNKYHHNQYLWRNGIKDFQCNLLMSWWWQCAKLEMKVIRLTFEYNESTEF